MSSLADDILSYEEQAAPPKQKDSVGQKSIRNTVADEIVTEGIVDTPHTFNPRSIPVKEMLVKDKPQSTLAVTARAPESDSRSANEKYLYSYIDDRALNAEKKYRELLPTKYQENIANGMTPMVASEKAAKDAMFESNLDADTKAFNRMQTELQNMSVIDKAMDVPKKVVSGVTFGAAKHLMQTYNPADVYDQSMPPEVYEYYKKNNPDLVSNLRKLRTVNIAAELTGNLPVFGKLLLSATKGAVTTGSKMVRSGATFSGITAIQGTIDPEAKIELAELGKSFLLGAIMPLANKVPGIGNIEGVNSRSAAAAKLFGQSLGIGAVTAIADWTKEALHGRSWSDLNSKEKENIALNVALMSGLHMWGGKGYLARKYESKLPTTDGGIKVGEAAKPVEQKVEVKQELPQVSPIVEQPVKVELPKEVPSGPKPAAEQPKPDVFAGRRPPRFTDVQEALKWYEGEGNRIEGKIRELENKESLTPEDSKLIDELEGQLKEVDSKYDKLYTHEDELRSLETRKTTDESAFQLAYKKLNEDVARLQQSENVVNFVKNHNNRVLKAAQELPPEKQKAFIESNSTDAERTAREMLQGDTNYVEDIRKRTQGSKYKYKETAGKILESMKSLLNNETGSVTLPGGEGKKVEEKYYSTVQRGVENIAQNTATGQQWLNMLRKIPGVSQREISYLGLERELGSKPMWKKSEILDIVDKNKLKVDVVEGDDYEMFSLGVKPKRDIGETEVNYATEDMPKSWYDNVTENLLYHQSSQVPDVIIDHVSRIADKGMFSRANKLLKDLFKGNNSKDIEDMFTDLELNHSDIERFRKTNEWSRMYDAISDEAKTSAKSTKTNYKSKAYVVPEERIQVSQTKSSDPRVNELYEKYKKEDDLYDLTSRLRQAASTLYSDNVEAKWEKGSHNEYVRKLVDKNFEYDTKDKELVSSILSDYAGKLVHGSEKANMDRRDFMSQNSEVANDFVMNVVPNITVIPKHFGPRGTVLHSRVNDRVLKDGSNIRMIEEIQSDASKIKNINHPLKSDWSELALKDEIQSAINDGKDGISWTTAKQQSERFSDEYEEMYNNQYDKDMPRFVEKYLKPYGIKPILEDMVVDTKGSVEKVWTAKFTPEMIKNMKGKPIPIHGLGIPEAKAEVERIIKSHKAQKTPKTFGEKLAGETTQEKVERETLLSKIGDEIKTMLGNERGSVILPDAETMKGKLGLDDQSVKNLKRNWYDRFTDLIKNPEVYKDARMLSGKILGRSENILKDLYNNTLKNIDGKEIPLLNRIYKLNSQIHWDRAGKTTEGVTEKMAFESLNAIKKEIGDEQFDKLSSTVNNIAEIHNNKLLDALVDGEVITKKTAEWFRKTFPVYLRIQLLDDAMPSSGGTRDAIAFYNKSFLNTKLETNKKVSDDIIELTRRSIVEKIVAAEKQKTINNILHEFGEKRGIVVEGSRGEGETLMNNSVVPMGYESMSRFNTRVPTGDRLDWVRKEFGKKLQKMNDGKEVTDEWIADNVKINYTLPSDIVNLVKGMNNESIDILTRAVGSYNTLFKTAATTWRLPFVINNTIRDTQNAILLDRIEDAKMSRIGGLAKGFKEATLDAMGFESKTAREFKEAGGGFGGVYTSLEQNVPLPRRLISNSNTKILRDGKNAILMPLKALETLAKVSENTTRYGAFERGRSAGLSDKEAAFLARDLTVDFQKYGDKMAVLNTYIPFLNAATQGNLNYIRFAKDKPQTAAARVAVMAVAPYIALKSWNALFEQEEGIPDYLKNGYWYFIVPDGEALSRGEFKAKTIKTDDGDELPILLTARKPEFSAALTQAIDPIVNYNIKKNKEWGRANKEATLAKVAASMTSNVAGGLVSGMVPPLISTAQETAANYKFWSKTPIVPRSAEGVEPKYQSSPGTTNFPRRFGEKFNVSPAKVENAITSLIPATQQLLATTSPLFKSSKGGAQNYAINSSNLDMLSKFVPVIKVPKSDKRTSEAYDWKRKDEQAKLSAGLLYKSILNQAVKAKTPADAEKIDKDIEFLFTNYAKYIDGDSRARLTQNYIEKMRLLKRGKAEAVIGAFGQKQKQRYYSEE